MSIENPHQSPRKRARKPVGDTAARVVRAESPKAASGARAGGPSGPAFAPIKWVTRAELAVIYPAARKRVAKRSTK